MSLSIIVPTKGRATLARTLDSVIHQMADDDEIIVVTDGNIPHVHDVVQHFIEHMPHGNLLLLQTEETQDNGASQRDAGIALATGEFLSFMDDDDIYTHDALAKIRRAMNRHQHCRMILFKMQAGDGNGWNGPGGGAGWAGTLWREPALEFGNVGTPMFVVDRSLVKVTSWARFHKNSHDFGFIYDVVTRNHGYTVCWEPEVIAIIRPSEADMAREALRRDDARTDV